MPLLSGACCSKSPATIWTRGVAAWSGRRVHRRLGPDDRGPREYGRKFGWAPRNDPGPAMVYVAVGDIPEADRRPCGSYDNPEPATCETMRMVNGSSATVLSTPSRREFHWSRPDAGAAGGDLGSGRGTARRPHPTRAAADVVGPSVVVRQADPRRGCCRAGGSRCSGRGRSALLPLRLSTVSTTGTRPWSY
jgi:hypothetical protein